MSMDTIQNQASSELVQVLLSPQNSDWQSVSEVQPMPSISLWAGVFAASTGSVREQTEGDSMQS